MSQLREELSIPPVVEQDDEIDGDVTITANGQELKLTRYQALALGQDLVSEYRFK